MNVAVIGGGWSGLAAAVALTRAGHRVTLCEMAARVGGRARRVDSDGLALDNGQHILIGAYTSTLELMRSVGVDVTQVLRRSPLQLMDARGHGLQLPVGAPMSAFLRGVLANQGWRWSERLSLLAAASRWALQRFECDESLSVASLTKQLPPCLRDELIDPLCVAALNTPAPQASGRVFLRVLKDALFSGPGSADLLLPSRHLDDLLPAPAEAWLVQHSARLRLGCRTMQLRSEGSAWWVDDERFDGVVLATTALEAARLVEPFAPAWAAQARELRYEPIVTVYLRGPQAALPFPMLALRSDGSAPAQFVFDHGSLRGEPGLLAFVISGAAPWLERGNEAILGAVRAQAASQLGTYDLEPCRVLTEKRATFACVPGLRRPGSSIGPRLFAAGDYIAGPYPATLEGAVRSGLEAAAAIG